MMPTNHQCRAFGRPFRIPHSAVVYLQGADSCIWTGFQSSTEESKDALDGPVGDLLHDVAGSRIVAEALGPLPAAEFGTGRIYELAIQGPIQNCLLGESTGEAYLGAWRNCTFPWPMSLDSRHPTASPAGPDLVGLKIEVGGHYLVFGEVKTSQQDAHPPRVMGGRSGLPQQLKDLRIDRELHRHLVRNLFFRCTGHLRERLVAAACRYTANPNDCRFFGVLVRDVLPDEQDLRNAVSQLGKDCPVVTRTEVLAIYLPLGQLDPVGGGSTSGGGDS